MVLELAISNLSLNAKGAKAVVEEGGISILVNLAWSTSIFVAERATGALWNLSYSEDLKERVVGVVANLATDNKCCTNFASVGVVHVLVTLTRTCEVEGVQEQVKRNSSTAKKRGPIQKSLLDLDFVEDDDALRQAIALSLQDSVSSPSRSPGAHLTNTFSKTSTKGNSYIENESGKRKRKKPISSRVQMTEDEMLVHFFQFDETGKGGFTLGDVQRVATAHDFTWSEKEMADMICCFDNDGDGKINFDDLRKIVGKCNMLKGSDGAGTVLCCGLSFGGVGEFVVGSCQPISVDSLRCSYSRFWSIAQGRHEG